MFNKKFLFVPVNGDLHWSLCVIVNLGQIMDVYYDTDTEDKQEDEQEKEFPG